MMGMVILMVRLPNLIIGPTVQPIKFIFIKTEMIQKFTHVFGSYKMQNSGFMRRHITHCIYAKAIHRHAQGCNCRWITTTHWVCFPCTLLPIHISLNYHIIFYKYNLSSCIIHIFIPSWCMKMKFHSTMVKM